MRVLHVGKYYPPFYGGIEAFHAALMDESRRQGVEAYAVVHAHTAGVEGGEGEGKEAEFITRVPSYGQLLYAPISPAFPFWLERAIERIRPHVIHIHVPNTSAFWLLLSRAAKQIPWVVHWHSDVIGSHIDKRLAIAYQAYKPFEQSLLAKASAIIATSEPYLATSKALSRWLPKCSVIPLGISDDATTPPFSDEEIARANSQWGPCKFRILAIGRLTYYKGHEILIRALADPTLDDKNYNQDAGDVGWSQRLILVGGGDRERGLRGLVQELGLKQVVTIQGGLTNRQVGALLATCDVLCLPSLERTEAFGVVLLEAMRAAKPVIASDIPGSGIGMVVADKATGLLVPPGDVSELHTALRLISKVPPMRQEMGRQARERFNDRFKIPTVTNDIIKLYGQIVGNTHNPDRKADKIQ